MICKNKKAEWKLPKIFIHRTDRDETNQLWNVPYLLFKDWNPKATNKDLQDKYYCDDCLHNVILEKL
jgi:hypothetical protein